MAQKRICVFGGSFNPLHNGHVALAKAVLGEGLADEVWLMVSPQNPLKHGGGLLPDAVRLEMARLGVEGVEGVRVSDFEFHLPRPSYTWKTLDALREAYPHCVFSLLVGGDNWALFSRWARHDYILKNYDVIVYPRTGEAFAEEGLPPRVTCLRAPLLDVSSTQIRGRLGRGESIVGLVPQKVADYMDEREIAALLRTF